jgi:hypothetical protein
VTGVIQWAEPPPSRSHAKKEATKWTRIADELRRKPGAWAHVENKPNGHRAAQTANLISVGKYSGMPAGQFEAVSRQVDGQFRVYARFVGEVTP